MMSDLRAGAQFDLEKAVARFALPDGVQDAVVNRTQLGIALQVSENTVTKYVQAGMPAIQEGANGREWQFQLSECYAWRMWRDEEQRLRRAKSDEAAQQLSLLFRNADEDDHGPALTARQIEEESSAEIRRLEAARRRGDLVQAARMRALLEDLLVQFKTSIMTLTDFAEMEFDLTAEQVAKLEDRAAQTLLQARAEIEASELQKNGAIKNLNRSRTADA
jgi:phage terminase Nu1 subunit (DNA packaging protein)